MDFEALPTATLHRYLLAWNLIPPLELLSSSIPPLPSTLLMQGAVPEHEPSITPANRPRRESKDGHSRRRVSSQSIEGDTVAVMADVDGVHHAFAAIAEQHFQQRPAVKEIETLTNFLAVANRNRGKVIHFASHIFDSSRNPYTGPEKKGIKYL